VNWCHWNQNLGIIHEDPGKKDTSLVNGAPQTGRNPLRRGETHIVHARTHAHTHTHTHTRRHANTHRKWADIMLAETTKQLTPL